jgi:multidrug transporter EmrE-like cation transporter
MTASNIFLFIFFFLFTCVGMVFIKLGAQAGHPALITLPFLGLRLSLISIIGFLAYGLSFVLYSTLLTRFELSYLNPATVGITSILIFICAVIVFGEVITPAKLGGLTLILSGVLVLNLVK